MQTSSFLSGVVTAEDAEAKQLIAGLVLPLLPFCEAHGWSEDNRWSFRADFARPEYVKLEEGELHDLLRTIYPILLDLVHFHEARFHMVIFLGGEGRELFTLQPHIISMCASLGMAIELIVDGSGEKVASDDSPP